MKKLIACVFFMLLSMSPALFSGQIKENDYAISFLQNIAVTSVGEMCPAGLRCVANGTRIELTLNVMGCFDRPGLFSHKAVFNQDRTLDLYVTAVNIHNTASVNARCTEETVKRTKVISLVNHYFNKEDIRVHVLK